VRIVVVTSLSLGALDGTVVGLVGELCKRILVVEFNELPTKMGKAGNPVVADTAF